MKSIEHISMDKKLLMWHISNAIYIIEFTHGENENNEYAKSNEHQ